MIKLKSLLSKSIQEAIAQLPPPTVSFLTRPSWHAYSKPASDGAGRQYFQGNIDYNMGISDGNLVDKTSSIIKKFENNSKDGFHENLWFPYKNSQDGKLCIGYGHKIQPRENFNKGITTSEAEDLLHKDIMDKITVLKINVGGFDALPLTVKIAAIDSMFWGNLGSQTAYFLSQNQFDKAAEAYLKDNHYSSLKDQKIKRRMEWNAKIFKGAA